MKKPKHLTVKILITLIILFIIVVLNGLIYLTNLITQ